METPPRPPSASPEPAAVVLLEAHLRLQQQHGFGGLLEVVTAAGRRLGASCYTGALLRDPGTDAWYLAALLDSQGRPVETTALGVALGPFPLTPPSGASLLPLAGLLGEAWSAEACARLERELGTVAALATPIPAPDGPCGVLFALFSSTERSALVAGVLAHAATAAMRFTQREERSDTHGVLTPDALRQQAEGEIARAKRYGRQLTIVAFHMESLARLAAFGPVLVGTLRQWDLVGRLDTPQPSLAAILPETGRNGGRGLLLRLGASLREIRTGAAIFPADGEHLDHLLNVACGRAAHAVSPSVERLAPAGLPHPWVRGAPTGPGTDTVRCPLCLASYTCGLPAGVDHAAEKAREAIRSLLQNQCPRHPEWCLPPDENSDRRGGIGGLLGRRRVS